MALWSMLLLTEGGSEGEGAGELGVGIGDYRDGVGAGEGADFHCGELLINDVIPDLIGSVVAYGYRKEFNVRGDVEGQLAILIGAGKERARGDSMAIWVTFPGDQYYFVWITIVSTVRINCRRCNNGSERKG